MSAGIKRRQNEPNFDSSNLCKRKQVAIQRWEILKETVIGGRGFSETQLSSVSVRRFQTFELLGTEEISDPEEDEEGVSWFCYTCSAAPHLSMKIRHVPDRIRPEDLLGFNNTGNVCVWPSEEVMTYYCLKHIDDFRGSSVLELGGGMSCLAGVALAVASFADQLVLTDGNEQSVHNLQKIIEANDFGGKAVTSRCLRWGAEPVEESLQEAFDWILCADCLFFDDGREDLLTTIYSLLKPGGQALLFAPGRNGTFDKFYDLVKCKFIADRCEQYDDTLWNKHLQLESFSETYSADLHLPLLLKLVKQRSPDADSRDTTPKSR